MSKRNLLCLASIFLFSSGYAQIDSVIPPADISIDLSTGATTTVARKTAAADGPVYKIKPVVDIPIVAAGTAWALFAFTKIYVKDPSTKEQILALKKDDVSSFDRWGIYPYDKSLDDISYYPFYAAIPLPLIYFGLDSKTRPDYWKLNFLYWEAMAITGLFGTGGTYFVDKYRPYAYHEDTPMDKRTNGLSKNSFYAGHVQVVAVPTFFIAKVYADYHPESNIKWVYYGVAAVATGATAYMRLAGGQHFPSDILLGAGMGVLTGILVPQCHKNKNKDTSLVPYYNGETYGFAFRYQPR